MEFINNLGQIPATAHHPACRHHHRHLIWLGNTPLCLGCSMMTCGAIAGIFLLYQLGTLTTQPYYIMLTLGVLLYIPAILQIFIRKKTYKIAARFSLGISVVFLFYGGLWLTPWSWLGIVLRIGFLSIFTLVWKLTLKIRSKYAVSPCQRCPEGMFPICEYTTPRIPSLVEKYFASDEGHNPEADDFVLALQYLHTDQINKN